jgi:ribonuclease HI
LGALTTQLSTKLAFSVLEAALELNIIKIDVYGDSMLIICQVKRRMKNQGREVKALQGILV